MKCRWHSVTNKLPEHLFRARMRLQPRFTRFVAEEFLLYESFLGSAGARHEVRERFPLGGH
jgi:hypothetical protein